MLKETTGAFDGARTHDWQVSIESEALPTASRRLLHPVTCCLCELEDITTFTTQWIFVFVWIPYLWIFSLTLNLFLILKSFSYPWIFSLSLNLFLIFESFPYLWIFSLSLNPFLIFESFPYLWIFSLSLHLFLTFFFFSYLWSCSISLIVFLIFVSFPYVWILSLSLNPFLTFESFPYLKLCLHTMTESQTVNTCIFGPCNKGHITAISASNWCLCVETISSTPIFVHLLALLTHCPLVYTKIWTSNYPNLLQYSTALRSVLLSSSQSCYTELLTPILSGSLFNIN